MEIRAARLLDADLVALALWPEPGDLWAIGESHPAEMPFEVRCVDRATAAVVESLVRNHPPDGDRPGPAVLEELTSTAERIRRGYGSGTNA